ncbi:MAG: aminoglycoside phosphotransferase [Acidimicrobiales bacterium]|jgi:aminoglycoside phosphotransferase
MAQLASSLGHVTEHLPAAAEGAEASRKWLNEQLGDVDVVADLPEGVLGGDRPDRLGDLVSVVGLVAEILLRIHALPIDDAPFDRGWEALASRLDNEVDGAELPEPYCRYDLATLQRLWRDGRPDTEDLVVCHGSPLLVNMGFGDGRLTTLARVDHPCVADRHLDLAIAHQSIQQHLGPEAVFAFYDAYGIPPDLVRLDHYVLASHLL